MCHTLSKSQVPCPGLRQPSQAGVQMRGGIIARMTVNEFSSKHGLKNSWMALSLQNAARAVRRTIWTQAKTIPKGARIQ